MNVEEICDELDTLADRHYRVSQERFGINTDRAIGVSVAKLRKLASTINLNHDLAIDLWETEIHEARILASMVDDTTAVTDQQMEHWVSDVNSWDLCDQLCINLFRKTAYAEEKAEEWLKRDEEFIKRAGYVLIASLAIHDDQLTDHHFNEFLHRIEESIGEDDRHYVKKGASWALREIGKRNDELRKSTILTANSLQASDSKPARWVGNDVLRELDN